MGTPMDTIAGFFTLSRGYLVLSTSSFLMPAEIPMDPKTIVKGFSLGFDASFNTQTCSNPIIRIFGSIVFKVRLSITMKNLDLSISLSDIKLSNSISLVNTGITMSVVLSGVPKLSFGVSTTLMLVVDCMI